VHLQLALAHIKNVTPDDLAVFNSDGVDEYVSHINRK